MAKTMKGLKLDYGEPSSTLYLFENGLPLDDLGPCCKCGGESDVSTDCPEHPFFCGRCYRRDARLSGHSVVVVGNN